MRMSQPPWVQNVIHSCHAISLVQPSQSRSQALAQDLMDPDLRRRDRELMDIAKSIESLAELFKDLSVLVIDQGTLLDSVEYNIEQTATHVQEAVRELNVAMRWVIRCYSRSIRSHISRHYQVSAKHGASEMHLPASAHHLWSRSSAYLQAKTTPHASTAHDHDCHV